jgi:hypothetical protein
LSRIKILALTNKKFLFKTRQMLFGEVGHFGHWYLYSDNFADCMSEKDPHSVEVLRQNLHFLVEVHLQIHLQLEVEGVGALLGPTALFFFYNRKTFLCFVKPTIIHMDVSSASCVMFMEGLVQH